MIESIFDCTVFKGYDTPTTVSYNRKPVTFPGRKNRPGYNTLLRHAYSIIESKYLQPYFDTQLSLNELYQFHIDTAGFYLGDSDGDVLTFIRKQFERDHSFGKDCLVGRFNLDLENAISFYTNLDNIKLFGECIRYIPDGGVHTKNILRKGGVSASRAYGPLERFVQSTKNFYYQRNVTGWLAGRFKESLSGGRISLQDVSHSDHYRIRRVMGFDYLIKPTVEYQRSHFLNNLMVNYLGAHRQWFEGGTYVNFKGSDIYVNHHSLFEGRDAYMDFMNHPEFPNQLPHGMLPDVYFKKPIEKLARTLYGKYRGIHMAKLKTHVIEMQSPKYRQLTTGIEMVNEGVRMEHCVGSMHYLEKLQNGEAIFFHLDLEDCKHGATLSMETTSYVSSNEKTYIGPCGGLWTVNQYYGYDDRDLDKDVVAQAELLKFLGTHFTIAEKPEVKVTATTNNDRDYFNLWGSNEVITPDVTGITVGYKGDIRNRIDYALLHVSRDEQGILDVAIGEVGCVGNPDSLCRIGRGSAHTGFSWVEHYHTDHRSGLYRDHYLRIFKHIRKQQVELLESVAVWSELDLKSEEVSLRSCSRSVIVEPGTHIWSPELVEKIHDISPTYNVSIRCLGVEHDDAFKIKAGESFRFTAKHTATLTFAPIYSSEHTELLYQIREIGV